MSLGVVASLLLLLGACGTDGSWVILPNLSPPVATVSGKAMTRAEEVAKTVPNSFVLITHGTASFAMYPSGTALVIQEIDFDHLRPGMTVIYYLDQQLSAALGGGVITRRDEKGWRIPVNEAWNPSGTSGREPAGAVTKDNFAGVVAAAFIESERYDPLFTLRNAPPEVANNCLLRCHVEKPRTSGTLPPK